jgi:hypothetical protein
MELAVLSARIDSGQPVSEQILVEGVASEGGIELLGGHVD